MTSILACVAHAGGTGAEYRRWRDRFPGWTVESVSLPGRDGLFKQPFLSSVEAMAEFVLGQLDPRAITVALFGHSLGAFVAYEAAHLLERKGRVAAALVLAGQHPPRPPRKRIHDLPKADLIRELDALGGLDPLLVENDEVFDLVLPRIRADLAAAHDYSPPRRPTLSCPLLAMGGDRDVEVSVADLDAWKPHTRAEFDRRVFAGDHFFHRPNDALVVSTIQGFLSRASFQI